MGQTCDTCQVDQPEETIDARDKESTIALDDNVDVSMREEPCQKEDEEVEECLCGPPGKCEWAEFDYHPPPPPKLPHCLCSGHICRIHHTGVCSCPEIFLDCCGKVRLKYTSITPHKRKNHFCCTGIPAKSMWDFCMRPFNASDTFGFDDECDFPECVCSDGTPKGPACCCVCPCAFQGDKPPDCYCKCPLPSQGGLKIGQVKRKPEKPFGTKDVINEEDIDQFLTGSPKVECPNECAIECPNTC